jgi:HEAT repeat protein
MGGRLNRSLPTDSYTSPGTVLGVSMGEPADLATTLLEADAAERRRAAASDLVEAATARPGAVAPLLDRVVGALVDPDDRVRTATARVCFEVGSHDPGALESVFDDLLAALDDPVAGVRTNVARPVADAVARDPDAGRRAAPVLRDLLDDRSDSVRHSAARGLEWLATRHPGAYPVDRLPALLDDDHPPVREHAARACALLPGAAAAPGGRERLVDLLNDEAVPVRTAAALALGADGDEHARRALARAARTDLNEGVRTAARRALRAATYDATAVPEPVAGTEADPLLAALGAEDRAVGRWLAVEDPAVTPRGGRFRGAVETVVSREGTLELHNEAVGYRLRLTRGSESWTGIYEGPERAAPVDLRPVEGRRLDGNRTPLRYAVEGDRVGFTVEGAPHAVEVTDRDTATGRVFGENWAQGYAVEFRPAAEGPLRALFERGRAFEVADVRLGRPDED